MNRTGVDQVVETDVLVIGGGLAGEWAAISASDSPVSVLLVDKATVGKSGCSVFAAGDISVLMPGDDLNAFVARAAIAGEYLNDQKLLESVWQDSYDRVVDMARWGVEFEKDAAGGFARSMGRGGMLGCVMFLAPHLMWTLRNVATSKHVRIMDKVAVVELVCTDGVVNGALGVNIQTGASYLFKAKAVVSAAGPCSFKSTYFGHRMATGEGQSIAHRAGATSTNMEFGAHHNHGHVGYDIAGMARFVGMGGKFVNAKGERFMMKYDPILGDRANHSTLSIAMAREVREGNGPIYFDLTSMSDADYELSRSLLPNVFRVFDRAGVDIRKERMEWCPQLSGTRSGPAGLVVDYSLATTVPGLYAAGDVAAKTHVGSCGGFHGSALTWAMVSGYRAGQSAARHAEGTQGREVDKAGVRDMVDSMLAPLRREKGASPDEITFEIQQTITPYDVVILRHAERLGRALDNIRRIREDVLPSVKASDSHELVKAHEAASMTLIAEMVLRAAIVRTETRGWSCRDDYPRRDDKNWLKWIRLKQCNGGMELWTERVPVEEYRFQPEESSDAH